MLAGRRKICCGGKEVGRTPLLVPSFSSKGFDGVQKIISTAEECITDCALVSAYDLHYKFVNSTIDFPELLFLDSGGYECGKDLELSDLGYTVHEPKPWQSDMHQAILDAWSSSIPTIFVSYDNPSERLSTKEQIDRARSLFAGRNTTGKELLIKPETKEQRYVQIENVISNVHQLADFDILGFTEKELGNSLLKKMVAIAKVRSAMIKAGINIPIHIFGSLDTVSTPLFFLAGADIFDGLTWLRFAYLNGFTTYIHNFAALELGVETKDSFANAQVLFRNYYYMKDLELQMRAYLNDSQFKAFTHHAQFFEKTFHAMQAELKEV